MGKEEFPTDVKSVKEIVMNRWKRLWRIVASVLKSLVLFVPAVIVCMLWWPAHGPLVTLFASLGVLTLTCAVVAFILQLALQVAVKLDERRHPEEYPDRN